MSPGAIFVAAFKSGAPGGTRRTVTPSESRTTIFGPASVRSVIEPAVISVTEPMVRTGVEAWEVAWGERPKPTLCTPRTDSPSAIQRSRQPRDRFRWLASRREGAHRLRTAAGIRLRFDCASRLLMVLPWNERSSLHRGLVLLMRRC